MVMFRTLYDASPQLLEILLQALCANELTIGTQFFQQISGKDSIPDGLILQKPLAIFIETKLGTELNSDQLKRHCKTIVERLPGQKGSFLISLTSGNAVKSVPEEVISLAKNNSITVASITFGELVTQIGQLIVTSPSLGETIQEFSDFIFAQHLIPRTDQFMVAMLTGTSWRENLKYGIYYEPSYRNPKWHRADFLGLYHDKEVSHVGRIVTTVSAMQDDTGEIAFDKPEKGKIDDSQRQLIREIIEAAKVYYPNLKSEQHRYYVVDTFTETRFYKSTPGGMMGHRYFDITSLSGKKLPSGAPGASAAEALSGHKFD